MSSSGAGPNKVRELYEQCSQLEKKWNRSLINQEKATLVRDWTFKGPVFDAFSKKKSASSDPDSELAIRYQILLQAFSKTSRADERLNLFAQWLWAEFDILPEDSLGGKEFSRLTSDVRKQVSRIPLNDLFYAQYVQIWLAYSEQLFQVAEREKPNTRDLKKRLRALGYETEAVEIYNSKGWRSPVEFICEWLATRGEIKMEKQRENSDIAGTLRNAYSRVMTHRDDR